jgi:hypothetical protein
MITLCIYPPSVPADERTVKSYLSTYYVLNSPCTISQLRPSIPHKLHIMPGLWQPPYANSQPDSTAYNETSPDGPGLFQVAPLNISRNNTTRTHNPVAAPTISQPYLPASPLRSESEVSPLSYQSAHASSRRASWTSIISPSDLPSHNTAPAHQLPPSHVAVEQHPAFRTSSQEPYPDYGAPRQDEQREYEPSQNYSQQPQYHHNSHPANPAHQTRQLYAPPDSQSYPSQSQYRNQAANLTMRTLRRAITPPSHRQVNFQPMAPQQITPTLLGKVQ